VFGSLAGVKQILAATGWQINTAFIGRVPLQSIGGSLRLPLLQNGA
jgi:hypothetical protein